jgi:hypothetical protein
MIGLLEVRPGVAVVRVVRTRHPTACQTLEQIDPAVIPQPAQGAHGRLRYIQFPFLDVITWRLLAVHVIPGGTGDHRNHLPLRDADLALTVKAGHGRPETGKKRKANH